MAKSWLDVLGRRGAVTIAALAALTGCGDPFEATEASFSYVTLREVGAPDTTVGTVAAWSVQQGLGSDGFNHKSLIITLTESNGGVLFLGSENGRLTGSSPNIGSYPVGDGSRGTVVVSGYVSTDGLATSGAVAITGTSGSTVVGHLDVWFGTPGLPAQSAYRVVGDFTAKHP